MKNNLISQTGLTELNTSSLTPKKAFITNVELKDGKTTNIVTLLCDDSVNIEELNIGTKTTLNNQVNYVSSQSILYSIEPNGKLKEVAIFPKVFRQMLN